MIETFIGVFIAVFVCGWGILIGYCIRVNQEERKKDNDRQE